MRSFDTAADLVPHIGLEIGVSSWLTVDQAMIDAFAEVSGDRQWIHVDLERAARERPDGRTIAHGHLIASLTPRLRVYEIRRYSHGLNYGSDRVRFIGPVPSGSRIRQRLTLADCSRIEGGYRIVHRSRVEVEGRERGAMAAETIALFYDPAE
jgi:acyl dehydratase